jgi:hypothetical protein
MFGLFATMRNESVAAIVSFCNPVAETVAVENSGATCATIA